MIRIVRKELTLLASFVVASQCNGYLESKKMEIAPYEGEMGRGSGEDDETNLYSGLKSSPQTHVCLEIPVEIPPRKVSPNLDVACCRFGGQCSSTELSSLTGETTPQPQT